MEQPHTNNPGATQGTGATSNNPKKIVLVDISHDAKETARDIADARLTAESSETKLFSLQGIINRVWKHGIAREAYRQSFIGTAQKNIEGTGNIFANTPSGSEEARIAYTNALVEQFGSELDDATIIHGDAGEKRTTIKKTGGGRNKFSKRSQRRVKGVCTKTYC